MAASSNPAAGRSKAHPHLTSQSMLPISAATRMCAQEADAAMTLDNREYHSPGVITEIQSLAASKYFLQ